MLAVERRLTSPLTVTLLLLLFSPPIPAAQAGSYSEISEALGGYAEFLLEEIPEVESLGNNPCAFVHGVLYVCFIGPGASCYPLVEANGLSLESFSFMITHVNEVALADDPEALAKARRLARSLSDWLLNKSSDRIGGLWASSQGRFIDVERSYYVLSGLIEAVRAGVLSPTDPGLLMSLNSLMGVQNGDGGWGYYPGMTELGPVYSESNVYVTSLALDILLRAYDAGVKPTGIERSIEKGIEFLQGAITVDGDEAYWQGAFHPAVGSIDAPVLSGYAGRALAMASTKVPAPAAHLSLMTKSFTEPFSSHLKALPSSAPTSITVRAGGCTNTAPMAAAVTSVTSRSAEIGGSRHIFLPTPVATRLAMSLRDSPAAFSAAFKASSADCFCSKPVMAIPLASTLEPSIITALTVLAPRSIPAVINSSHPLLLLDLG